MPYALQSMLKIREMREDRAGTELTGARRARAVAEQERDAKRDKRREFEATKDERRDRVYAAVIGRVVSLDDLDDARAAVTRIDEEGMLLVEAENKAQQQLDVRDKEAEAAKVRYIAASRNKMKIEQHKAIWEEEDRREQERKSDSEMEEFTGRKMVGEDDDSID